MTAGKKILLVDDDDSLRDSLSQQLRLHGKFLIVEAATAAEALETTKGEYFDAVILDIGLPDMDGREVCRLMRRNGVKSPIIMLTGQDTDADQILSLDAGANDYVTKPFRRAVIAAGLDPAQVTPHVMRHTAITNLVKAGVDLPTIQKISGHKTLVMVLRYVHVHGRHIDQAIRTIGRGVPKHPVNTKVQNRP